MDLAGLRRHLAQAAQENGGEFNSTRRYLLVRIEGPDRAPLFLQAKILVDATESPSKCDENSAAGREYSIETGHRFLPKNRLQFLLGYEGGSGSGL